MSSAKKTPKAPEDIQAVIQALIVQGKKDGMIQASDLNAQLEKLDLTPEKIEEIYDRFDAMGIQIITAELELDTEDVLDAGDDLIDLPVLRRAGVAVTPADGVPEVDEAVHWRTATPGGHGVACEIVRRVLTAQNKLEEEMKRYRK